jgi:hypothetical protein
MAIRLAPFGWHYGTHAYGDDLKRDQVPHVISALRTLSGPPSSKLLLAEMPARRLSDKDMTSVRDLAIEFARAIYEAATAAGLAVGTHFASAQYGPQRPPALQVEIIITTDPTSYGPAHRGSGFIYRRMLYQVFVLPA